ncbi:MAG: hypothetical protein JWM59_3606 [Verrucomicrobiales bacterium]|nr:hypothetical protein [Verrucomicrobiales bacterium]
MNVEIFAICDAATVSSGKLNILGAFDTVSAASFPTRHENCTIACRLRGEVEERESAMRLEMRIIDPDGRAVIEPVSNEIQDRGGLQHHLWHIHGFEIPQPGTFFVDLLVDGRLLSRLPVHILKIPQSGLPHLS